MATTAAIILSFHFLWITEATWGKMSIFFLIVTVILAFFSIPGWKKRRSIALYGNPYDDDCPENWEKVIPFFWIFLVLTLVSIFGWTLSKDEIDAIITTM